MHYNILKSHSQYLIDDFAFLNKVRLKQDTTLGPPGIKTVSANTWLGPLSGLIKSGSYRTISYFKPDIELLKQELSREPLGYLVAGDWVMTWLIQNIGVTFLKDSGLFMWVPLGSSPAPALRQTLVEHGIRVRAQYSCEEAGSIGVECPTHANFYHVSNSNVIVELDESNAATMHGERVAPVLITHLHSYATPFIRYEIGDLATLHDRCPCGHVGPVLSNIHGKGKNLLRHANGDVSPFYFNLSQESWLLDYEEYRIKQVAYTRLVVEVGGRETLTPDETTRFVALAQRLASDDFEIEVRALKKIDWGENVKRLVFTSEID